MLLFVECESKALEIVLLFVARIKVQKNTTTEKTKVIKPVPCTGMSRINLLKQEQEMLDKAAEMGNGIRLASDPFKMCMVFSTKWKADTGTHFCCPNTLWQPTTHLPLKTSVGKLVRQLFASVN